MKNLKIIDQTITTKNILLTLLKFNKKCHLVHNGTMGVYGQGTIQKFIISGKVDENMPWSAHIYWYIDYQIANREKKKVTAKLFINKNSWVKKQKRSQHLLNHQQGHYLIGNFIIQFNVFQGALCLLEFLRRIDKKKSLSSKKFEDLVFETFERTMKQYLELQKKYDIETEHRLNFQKQLEWDCFIFDKLNYYQSIFDKKNNKFVKLSEKASSDKKR